MMINIKKKEVSILLAILASLLLTQSAYAADLFTVPETDKSKLWFLDILFPDNLAESPLASTMTILNSAVSTFMKAEKIETGNLNVPQLYEMEKVSEQENVAEKYPEKVFELQTILRQVRNKRIKM